MILYRLDIIVGKYIVQSRYNRRIQ